MTSRTSRPVLGLTALVTALVFVTATTAATASQAAPAVATAATTAPTPCGGLDVVAHRGYHPQGVDENTLRAFREAIYRGFSVELDVWNDAQGQLWVFHDQDINRATGLTGNIDQMTTAEVSALRYRKAGTRLARLSETLALLASKPGVRAYVEPKRGALAAPVADAIIRAGITDRTWVTAHGGYISGSRPDVRLLRKLSPTAPAPDPAALARAGYDIVAFEPSRLNAEVVARYESAGVQVQGTNTASTTKWRRTIGSGASGQTTDAPVQLKTFCPIAFAKPLIEEARRPSESPSAILLGRAFVDVSRVMVAGEPVPYEVRSRDRIRVTLPTVHTDRAPVVVKNPNGRSVKRLVLRR